MLDLHIVQEVPSWELREGVNSGGLLRHIADGVAIELVRGLSVERCAAMTRDLRKIPLDLPESEPWEDA